jgi:uncharacterized membrane protein YeaQ/YmgE (transglycosylase-associated protein family)
MHLIYTLIIGGLAGWIAGLLLRGRGCGCFGNIIVGIIGSYVGLFIAQLLKMPIENNFSYLILTIIGAMILLSLAGINKRK